MRGVAVSDAAFAYVGDSAVALWGDTDEWDGRSGEQPRGTSLARVLAHVGSFAFTGLHPCVHPAARPGWEDRMLVGRACQLSASAANVRGLVAHSPGPMKEAMRLYPPAYTMTRLAEEDTIIGGYPVPAGSEVVLWIYWAHHDPRWWPDPEAFRPERFTPEEAAKRPKLAYMPFGAGARACIGKVFAIIEATLILAELAQRYRFELVPGHPVLPRPRITLAPKHGMQMTLRAR